MGVALRISRDLAYIRSEEFRDLCRTRPEDFTRRRKLTAEVLAESLLARRGRTLSIELRDMRRDAGVDVTKWGYLKAREKMRPEALRELMRHHARSVYADGDATLFHGMVVVDVDGSSANVPTNDETLERYGNASCPDAKPQAAIGISEAFDPLTDQLLDISLHRGKFNERAQVANHLVAASWVTGGLPLLFIGDRGYPSLLLMALIECAGEHYLIRCSKGFLTPEFRAAEEAGGDLWIDVRLTRHRLKDQAKTDPDAVDALVALGTLRVRFCIVDIGGEEPERLVTNLGEDVLPHEGLKGCYWMRWPAETTYEYMKDRLQMENFTGTKPVLIEQDVYATGYLANLAFDLAREADEAAGERIEAEGKEYKHEMVANRTFAIGSLKEDLYSLVLAGEREREALMATLVEEVSHELVPVRTGRPAYPRDGLSGRARRYSNTHKRAF